MLASSRYFLALVSHDKETQLESSEVVYFGGQNNETDDACILISSTCPSIELLFPGYVMI